MDSRETAVVEAPSRRLRTGSCGQSSEPRAAGSGRQGSDKKGLPEAHGRADEQSLGTAQGWMGATLAALSLLSSPSALLHLPFQ